MRLRSCVRNHWVVILCGFLSLPLIFAVKPAYPETRVFKCTSATGQISFSQTGCEIGIREPLVINNPDVGWINLKPVLSKIKAKSDKGEKKSPKRKVSGSRSGKGAQQQKCWRVRKKVARIERELKRGYKLGRGEDLRYQRTEQEEYLALFCKQSKP